MEVNGTGLQYAALVLAYADLSNNLFLKIQGSGGSFTDAACYYGNNGSSFGLGFFSLDLPFAKVHMAVTLVGTTVTMTFSSIDGGAAIQTYVCGGAPVSGGIGIGGFATRARLDNFSTGGSAPVSLPGTNQWALIVLASVFAGVLLVRLWRARPVETLTRP